MKVGDYNAMIPFRGPVVSVRDVKKDDMVRLLKCEELSPCYYGGRGGNVRKAGGHMSLEIVFNSLGIPLVVSNVAPKGGWHGIRLNMPKWFMSVLDMPFLVATYFDGEPGEPKRFNTESWKPPYRAKDLDGAVKLTTKMPVGTGYKVFEWWVAGEEFVEVASGVVGIGVSGRGVE